MSWGSIKSIEIHGFADVSESAYGTCVYLAWKHGNGIFKTSLVLSRAHVAPLKVQSLPKLELMAALLCACLAKFVRKALRLSGKVLVGLSGDPHMDKR